MLLFGPFHRVESPTQTSEVAAKQVSSSEIWGRASKPNGLFPCVKAYPGALSPERRGIEFTTPVQPDLRSSTPIEWRWYYPQTSGVERRLVDAIEYAAIRADVVNSQPL